jgi:hypothetical protein
MGHFFTSGLKSQNKKQAPLPWVVSGKYSHVNSLWAEESNYAMALRAASLRRLQGSSELTDLEYFNPWLDADQEVGDLELYEAVDASSVSLNRGRYTSY